ncbi:ubiquinol-cytochrome C reductase complex subunit oxen [Colletes latitarsis]|uniref:ubiquinol-cytochrome C reductase complex subunit oxen n=1 Tax=Colletes latitarsis TaxID=2605962 RepID=UPI0040361A11
MAGLASTTYNLIFKRTSALVFTIMVTSFFFERVLDVSTDNVFENVNKGKLWKDIEHKYVK